METIVLGLISIFSGAGLFVMGFYVGTQISVKRYLDRVEKKDKEKSIKQRDKAEYVSRMTDQEAREDEDNSIERINKEVI